MSNRKNGTNNRFYARRKARREQKLIKAYFSVLFLLVIACIVMCCVVLGKVSRQEFSTELPKQVISKQTTTRTEIIEREQETVTITEITESVEITNVDYTIREITEEELEKLLGSKVVYFDVPLSKEIQDYCYYCSDMFGVPVTLIIATIDKESDFNPNARSASKDSGLMQVNDCNLKTLKEKFQIDDIFDPYQNILGGTYLLSENIKAAGGEIQPGLMAYNMGLKNAKNHWSNGVYSSKYSRAVFSLYQGYEEQMKKK